MADDYGSPLPASAERYTHSTSSSLLHLADHAQCAARTLSPSPGRSRGRERHIVHGPDSDREDVESVFERDGGLSASGPKFTSSRYVRIRRLLNLVR